MRMVYLITACFLSVSSLAQEPQSAELLGDSLIEHYDPEVSVSGNVIVGVMTASAGRAILSNDIVISTRRGSDDRVCLRASSLDGIYTSKNSYALPELGGASVHLPYQSKLANFLENYDQGEIALSATPGDCSSGNTSYFVLSAANEESSNEVSIFLNSFGATDVFYELDADINECEYLSEGRRTTFDFICRLGVIDQSGDTAITIIRERFGREQPTIEMRIIGSDP